MRHVILLDNKITDKQFTVWRVEDTEFWKKYIGITPEYTVIHQDYSDYPTYIDNDGDIRPTAEYLKALTKQVEAIHGPYGTDFIMVMIHEDNWKSDPPRTKGIWGTNYSYVFGTQCLDYCRWDRNNNANTFGTAYHERHHSLDAIIKQELGVSIEPLLSVPTGRYDYCITHGKCAGWDYIRWKENTDSLVGMAPYLRDAFAKRRQRHDARLDKMRTIIAALQQIVYLLRALFNKKNGVPR